MKMKRPPLIALLVCLPAALLRGAGEPKPYNVLFLMCDEHNPHVMACAGDPLVKTPNLDSLAAAGVRFSAAYCQNPICVPSRVSLISGRMPCHLNTFGNTDNQKYEGITTLADVFVKAGYQTVWYGKTHWGNPRFMAGSATNRNEQYLGGEDIGRLPQQSKVSDWPVEKNSEHLTAEEAIQFLKVNKDKKFFLGVSFLKPHFPYTVQQQYYDLYKGKVTPPRDSQELIHELPKISQKEREKYGFDKATPADISRTRALYYGAVTYVDEEFGRILKTLDDLGLRDNTIIVYTADHGDMLGDHGIWYKNAFFDGSATIPFIWSFPRELPKGKVSEVPVMNMDVFPTLCELCRLPAPKGLEGSSLIPVMKDPDAGKQRYALSENYRAGAEGRMIRTPQWKYWFYANGDEALYDIQKDPGEEHNVAKNPENRALIAKLKEQASAGWVRLPGKEKAKAEKKGKKDV